jgi:hypothetical protein
MSISAELEAEGCREYAEETRETVRWYLAMARKALNVGESEIALWNLDMAKLWRRKVNYWTRRGRLATQRAQMLEKSN